MKNRFFKISAWLVLTVLAVCICLQGASAQNSGIDHVTTNNYANKKLEFYYYIPRTVSRGSRSCDAIVAVPGLNGRGEQVGRNFIQTARSLKMVIIAPSFVFDEKNFHQNKSYHFPDAWSGDALLKIINKMKTKYNVRINKLYMYGFSAGAQFVLRFSLLKPEMVDACVGHGSGMGIRPTRYVDVKFFVTVGKQDKMRIDHIRDFYHAAKKQNIKVYYREYPGGHVIQPEQLRDAQAFFKFVKTGK